MNIRIGFVLAWLAVLPALGSAQTPLTPGERVRIHHADGTVTTGVLAATNAEGVRLAPEEGGPELPLGISEIDRLERSLGVQPRFFRNFAIGVGITAVGGGLITAATWTPCRETGWFACFMHPESRTDAFGWGLAVGGVVGLGVGFLAGALIRSEHWEELPIPGREAGIVLRPILGSRVGFSASIPVGGRSVR